MRARSSQELRALLASETAERLVEEHEGNIRSQESSSQPNPLAFTAGNEATSLTKQCLVSLGQHLEHRQELGLLDDRRQRKLRAVAVPHSEGSR